MSMTNLVVKAVRPPYVRSKIQTCLSSSAIRVRMLTFFLGTLVGAAFILIVIFVLIVDPWAIHSSTPSSSFVDQYRPIEIPKELREFLKTGDDGQGVSRWESCHSVSLLLHMFFQEHKDGRHLRRWFHKRLQIELNDICTRSAAGRLIQEVRIRDLSLGTTAPRISAIRVESVEMSSDKTIFEKIILLIDMEYTGGFETSIDVTTVFGKKANLSIKLAKVAGLARLILSRKPYNHWTFSFVSTPELAMDVSSQIQGHQLKRLIPLIKESIRRAIQRKHVWPNYKIRYRPLFPNPFLQPSLPLSAFTHVKIEGGLEVTVLQGTRLKTNLVGKDVSTYVVYCTVNLDSRPFLQNSSDFSHSLSVMLTFSRHDMTTPIGIIFEKTMANANGIRPVRVAVVEEGSLADKAAFKPGDTLMAINNVPIRSERQAIRFLQQTIGDLLVLVDRNLDDIDDNVLKSCTEMEDGRSSGAVVRLGNVSSTRPTVVQRRSLSPDLDPHRRHSLSNAPSDPSIINTTTDSITSFMSLDAQLSRPINTVSVLRTESDRVPQLFVSQPSVELRRTRSESQLPIKPLDSLSMRSTTSAGLEDEVVSVYTVSSLDSELANEKLLPSFEEISDCNDTLTQNLLTPRQKDSTLTPGMTLADIEREAVASTMISRPSCVAEHVDRHAESASSIASSACFRPEDDFDDDMLLRCRPTSTRKQRLHATLRASKRRVLDLMQKRRVATASPNGDTVEIGADAIDFSAVANSDRESPLALSGKRSPVETHVVDKKEKVKKRKHRSPILVSGHSTPSLHDSPTTSTRFIRSRSTRPVPLQENVLWGQSLHYDLDGTSSSPSKTLCKYLNITVHAKELPHTPVVAGTNPASTDIVQATPVLELEPSQPILLGYTSLYIPQILDDCQLTLSNYHREVYQLKPPTEVQSIFEASTPEFCRHAGYDPRLCYGDVTLGFRFFPEGFPSGAGALNTEESDEEVRIDETFVVTKAPTLSPASVIPTNQHVWKTWTSKGTTICALCRGKIWLKSASCCQRCGVVCHHKCVERAASGIPCSPHAVVEEDKPFDEVDVDINSEGGTKEDYPPCDVAAASHTMQPVSANGNDVELTSRRVRLRNKMTEKLSSWRRGGKATAKQHLDAGNRDSHYSDFSAGVVSEKEELLSPMANIQDCLADVLPTLDGSPFIRSLYFRPGDAYNEQTINHAKLLGKEIFSDLRGEERKAMINEQIDRIQLAIRETKEGRLTTKDETEKKSANTFIGQDERLQALAVVMLHYCAALQDCESQGSILPSAGTFCSGKVLERSAEGYSLSSVCSSTDEISNNIVVFEPTTPTTTDDESTTKSTYDKLNHAFLVMTQEQDSLKEE